MECTLCSNCREQTTNVLFGFGCILDCVYWYCVKSCMIFCCVFIRVTSVCEVVLQTSYWMISMHRTTMKCCWRLVRWLLKVARRRRLPNRMADSHHRHRLSSVNAISRNSSLHIESQSTWQLSFPAYVRARVSRVFFVIKFSLWHCLFVSHVAFVKPSPPVGNILAVIVWRLRAKINRIVMCCVIDYSYAQS